MNSSTSKVIGIIVVILVILGIISFAANRTDRTSEDLSGKQTTTTYPANGMFYTTVTSPGVASSSVATTTYVVIGAPVKLNGTYICLPHRNTSGPTTMECAFGMKGDDGLNYALDTSALATSTRDSLATSDRITIDGIIVPTAQIAASFWNTYNIHGAVRVTALKEI